MRCASCVTYRRNLNAIRTKYIYHTHTETNTLHHKTNHRYMTKSLMINQITYLRNKTREKEIYIKNLEKKIENDQHSTPLDDGLHQDLSTIMQKHNEIILTTQRIVSKEYFGPTSMKLYHRSLAGIFAGIQQLSSGAYSYGTNLQKHMNCYKKQESYNYTITAYAKRLYLHV